MMLEMNQKVHTFRKSELYSIGMYTEHTTSGSAEHETLPIYNGGCQVTLRRCDRNTFVFPLRGKEWITSWLSFEVWDDNLLTSSDVFIGAVCIDLSGIKAVGKSYYTQLPLINKKGVSQQLQMNTTNVKSPTLSAKAGIQYTRVPSDTKTSSKQEAKAKMDELVSNNAHLNITGVLHVKAKKIVADLGDVFSEKKEQTYNLEIEILAVSNMTTLKLQGMDTRRFKWGILIFILYLIVYSVVMFLAELHTDTGMNDYRESLWFSFITITTLGYGDVYAQTALSKVLNAFFIVLNVCIIGGFVGELVGYVVNSGEQSLNERMDHLMEGAHGVFNNKEQIQRQQLCKGNQKNRSQSVQIKPKDIKQLDAPRRLSEPALSGIKEDLNECEEEEKAQQRVAAVEAVEVETAKTSKLKLDELRKIDDETRRKLKRNIGVNICLLIIVALFGFFVMGICLLLDGPNWLTANGYSCSDHSDPHCQKDHSKMVVDSIYYVIVSMSTVGYGDIYPLFPEQSPVCAIYYCSMCRYLILQYSVGSSVGSNIYIIWHPDAGANIGHSEFLFDLEAKYEQKEEDIDEIVEFKQ